MQTTVFVRISSVVPSVCPSLFPSCYVSVCFFSPCLSGAGRGYLSLLSLLPAPLLLPCTPVLNPVHQPPSSAAFKSGSPHHKSPARFAFHYATSSFCHFLSLSSKLSVFCIVFSINCYFYLSP